MKKIFIIAEAGVNHNGSVDLAKKLINVAIDAKCDAVKFQTFKAENIVSKSAQKADYQISTTGDSESQFKMIKKLELAQKDFIELKAYTEKNNMRFMSTPFDLLSVDFLRDIEMKTWKIPSGEITNLPYLIKIAKLNKPVILSTGMSTLGEIKDAVKVLTQHGTRDITLLHCTTEYPTPYEDVNLNAIKTMKKEFGLPIGYSDHTLGIEVAVAAVAMGATVIEKHFTLDRGMDGPDHKASLEPNELKAMVEAIRNIEKALGTGEKKPMPSEIKNMAVARKSIVAKKNIKKGEILSEENLTTKRPGTGISPMKWVDVLGQKATKDYEEDELIEL